MRTHTAILAGAALLLLAGAPVSAQTLMKSTFYALTKAQKLIEEEKYGEAVVQLEALVAKTQGASYDYARVNQYLAHASLMAGKGKRARQAVEAALTVPVEEMDLGLLLELKLLYGQMLIGDEEYETARVTLEEWLAAAPDPAPNYIFSLAYASYMSGEIQKSRPLIARSIAESNKPQNSWYQLYYRILMELKDYREAESVLYSLISQAPDEKPHWRMLASHYLQIENESDALASLMIAYRQTLIDDTEDLDRIITLYSMVGVPEKAARLLSDWMEEDKIPTDAETLEKLGSLWLVARERGEAKTIFQKAAAAGKSGKTYERLASIHFEDEEWREAYSAYRQAYRIGGTEEPSRVSLLAGISALRAEMFEEARASLETAAKSEKYRQQAERMLQKLSES